MGRRTCELVLGDDFLFCDNTSTFELAFPGEDFEVFLTNDWTRSSEP